MGSIVIEEVFLDVGWKGLEHLVYMEGLDIPVLGTMGEDDLCLDFVCLKEIVAVMPELVVVPCFAIQLLLNLFQISDMGCMVAEIVSSPKGT